MFINFGIQEAKIDLTKADLGKNVPEQLEVALVGTDLCYVKGYDIQFFKFDTIHDMTIYHEDFSIYICIYIVFTFLWHTNCFSFFLTFSAKVNANEIVLRKYDAVILKGISS